MSRKALSTVFGLLVAAVVASAGYLYTLINHAGDRWPSLGKVGSLTQQINALNYDVNALRTEVTKIPEAQERLEKITVEFELASRVLPRESSPDQLLAAIRTKAQQVGVSPSSIDLAIAGGGRGGAFETWRFSLAIQGSYDQIASFINRMEEFESQDAASTGSERRFFELKEFTISAQQSGLANLGAGGGNNPILHNSTLAMQTYRYTGE